MPLSYFPHTATICSVFSVFQPSTSLLHTNTHTFFPVAITNKVEMTQQEVCARTELRNPTGPSWKTATGTSGAFVNTVHVEYVCTNGNQ